MSLFACRACAEKDARIADLVRIVDRLTPVVEKPVTLNLEAAGAELRRKAAEDRRKKEPALEEVIASVKAELADEPFPAL